MQHISLIEAGDVGQMRWQPMASPVLAPHEVLVRHEAIGVNYIDVYHRTGLYPQPAYPAGLGVEAAGVIEAVGSAVQGFTPNMRVAYIATTPGSYATHRAVAVDRLIPLPDWLDCQTAAAILLQGLTAHYLLHSTFEVLPQHTVLLHAAAGGVGLLVAQWARHHGAMVIGTVGSAAKIALATEHGCQQVIDYRREDFVARVKEITEGQGVDVVYDSVGQATFAGSLQCLKPRGMMVSFGQASGAIPPFDCAQLGKLGSLYLTRPSLFHYIATHDELARRAAHLFLALKARVLQAPPLTVFPLQEAAMAHRALESRETVGKIVLEV